MNQILQVMKKILMALMLCIVSVAVFTSCEKDENTKHQIEKISAKIELSSDTNNWSVPIVKLGNPSEELLYEVPKNICFHKFTVNKFIKTDCQISGILGKVESNYGYFDFEFYYSKVSDYVGHTSSNESVWKDHYDENSGTIIIKNDKIYYTAYLPNFLPSWYVQRGDFYYYYSESEDFPMSTDMVDLYIGEKNKY